jgi:hypothetical protein
VRNTWRATNPVNGVKLQFAGIVIWRIAQRQLVGRWANSEASHPTCITGGPVSISRFDVHGQQGRSGACPCGVSVA